MRVLIDAAAFLVVGALAYLALDDVLVALVAALIAAGGAEAMQRRGN